MSYRAKVIKVMIASPSDVKAERNAVRNVLHEWNNAHSEDKNIVLMPLGWDSHATPAMGDRPQALINKQVLKGCDLLIAIFWTKVGTPTGKAISGTVEEIEEHVKARKPAMIYFSTAPVAPGMVDNRQYEALQDFKRQLQDRGLYAEYGSSDEFREILTRQLAQTINRHFASKKNVGDADGDIRVVRPKVPSLSDRAQYMLIEASHDPTGTIIRAPSAAGHTIDTNGMNVTDLQSPKNVARWESALVELCDKQLIHDSARKGEVFVLTDEGYRVADLLKERQLVLG